MDNKSISFKDIFVKGAVIFNPVLVQLAGLCPVVAATTTLKNAALISVAFCTEIIVCCVFASAFLKKAPRWIRVPVHFLLGLLLMCPLLYYIERDILIDLSLSMKIFIPIIAVNSVTAVHCEQFAVKNSVKLAFFDAAAVGIGTSFVFLLTGAIREIFGNGTIGGISLDMPVTFKATAMPFGCLIILGFMAAVLKAIIMKKYPEYLADGITFKSISVLNDTGVAEEKEEKKEEIMEDFAEVPVTEEADGDVPAEIEELNIFEEYTPVWEENEEPVEEKPAETKHEAEIQITDFGELFKSLEIEIEKRTEGNGQ